MIREIYFVVGARDDKDHTDRKLPSPVQDGDERLALEDDLAGGDALARLHLGRVDTKQKTADLLLRAAHGSYFLVLFFFSVRLATFAIITAHGRLNKIQPRLWKWKQAAAAAAAAAASAMLASAAVAPKYLRETASKLFKSGGRACQIVGCGYELPVLFEVAFFQVKAKESHAFFVCARLIKKNKKKCIFFICEFFLTNLNKYWPSCQSWKFRNDQKKRKKKKKEKEMCSS
jgi:hypothetical protein